MAASDEEIQTFIDPDNLNQSIKETTPQTNQKVLGQVRHSIASDQNKGKMRDIRDLRLPSVVLMPSIDKGA